MVNWKQVAGTCLVVVVAVIVAVCISYLLIRPTNKTIAGQQGPAGLQGAPGENGVAPVLQFSSENYSVRWVYENGSATGWIALPRGPSGERGQAGASGQSVIGPQGVLGKNGVAPVLEYNSDNYSIRWVYDNGAATEWIALPQGEQGPAGESIVGPQGENGKDANVLADVEGLLTLYSDGEKLATIDCGPHYYDVGVEGFLVNFGTEAAENVRIVMAWDNATENIHLENTICVGHLKGHGLFDVEWSGRLASDPGRLEWTWTISWG